MFSPDRLGKGLGLIKVRGGCFHPQQIGIGGKGKPADNASVKGIRVTQLEKAFLGAFAGNERLVAVINVGCDQLGAFSIGARHDDGRNAGNIGGKSCRVQISHRLAYRDQHFAAHMAAFLFRCQLVFKMHAGNTGLDIVTGQFKRVQRPAKAGLGISDDGCEPVGIASAFQRLDLVGALQCAVDPACEFGPAICRIERLVGIHAARRVGIGGNLPARQINGLEAGADHLHGLVAGHGTKRRHIILGGEKMPEFVSAMACQRVVDTNRAGQLLDICHAVITLRVGKAAGGCLAVLLERLLVACCISGSCGVCRHSALRPCRRIDDVLRAGIDRDRHLSKEKNEN
ncbi:MAG: Uncharacterised protein [SAR116 cluster bacterium]|nr:MAG: Uncharacterised protein [SAR116 cluster bacterium]